MIRTSLVVLCLSALLPCLASAERTIPLSGEAGGVFDQPSAAVSGSTVHVAYVGGDNTAGPFTVYYAAVQGGADFSNLTLPRSAFVLTEPVAVADTSGGPDNVYYDARHPRIAVRGANEVVLYFQARPAPADDAYALFQARLAIDNNQVTGTTVRRVGGIDGALSAETVSFALVAPDNTARLAYAARPAASDPDTTPFDVYFARVALDNATVSGSPGTPLRVTLPGAEGFRPLPSLRLDGLNRAHIAWSANGSGTSPAPVYYALVKETGGTDNVVIAATNVLGGGTRRWEHPCVHVSSNSSIFVTAADASIPGVDGPLGLVNLNPDADRQDGGPVDNVSLQGSFLLTPPGVAELVTLPSVSSPEMFLDPSGNFHATGYGSPDTYSIYFAFKISAVAPYAETVTPGAYVGGFGLNPNEFPGTLPGEFSRAGFGYLSGKVVVFWSGIRTDLLGNPTGARTLDVTALPAVAQPIPLDESGCRAAPSPGSGDAGPALAIVLPLLVLALLRTRANGGLRRTDGGR